MAKKATVIENTNYEDVDVLVDAKTFVACRFTNVTLVYGGGELPDFVQCKFSSVTLHFTDAAANTLEYLAGLSRSGFSSAVSKIADSIRTVPLQRF